MDDLPDPPGVLWRAPEPRRSYDVVIVGAGGHGLATAYYLARNHGITDVAVLERGWLAGGNMARNTAIIRSNYLWDESAGIYEHALKLWEGLEEELGHPLLFSQRGVLNLAHSLQDVRDGVRRVNANRLNGVDAEWLGPEEVGEVCPIVDVSPDVRHPVLGATYQPRAGIAKHDHVAWGFARAAAELGVHLVEHCEVTGIEVAGGRARAVLTAGGRIAAGTVALCAAGRTSVVAGTAGVELPLQSHTLQALVSELLEPVHPTVVMSNAVHVYVSQAHKGELVMGAGIDAANSYRQRGAFHVVERQMAAALELFPVFARAHVLRTWAGVVDVSPDASPIIGRTPVDGLLVNCGWGTGGFKATPGVGWCFAHTIAHGEPHPLAAPFSLDRFTTGALVDEHGAAAVAH
ncbi:sarcosine oxidase subunit beta [Planomonospora parontospora subsp. parontospora]|uniref:Sarcosine oxidase subunit beta n=2 Tax=Planomonospora parontospora TaxID=58119 RepID=A0AA37BAX1_9ACTN|nr:sarcosine oxidase subunit beta family protein [Planomonospora parontospora]GGK45208.1 sarcosine oxidase subunit beta [Planomonospora parontospora]GII06292.1 sarcosine oxidase subunit beta [Planomonospora parontospora subsp. parontospora]